MTVGSVTYPLPGFNMSISKIAPLPSTVLTIAVACTPLDKFGAVIDTVEDVVYPDPPLITSIPLLALPP